MDLASEPEPAPPVAGDETASPTLLTAGPSAPELSVVVPCFNERDNVAPLAAALEAALVGRRWELIIVDDDSPDGTAAVARGLGARDGRIRCIRRIGRRGLSSAVIEGALAASGRIVAVMDGDLQHDESILPALVERIERGDCDVAVGSRLVEGGDRAGLASGVRVRLSDAGIGLARLVLPVRLTDPMSGYFVAERALFERVAPRLSSRGFKILLDLLMSADRPLRVDEIPFRFRSRHAGTSKLDLLVLFQFAGVLLDKLCRGMVPIRFLGFALVGLVGVAINLVVLALARHAGLDFSWSQTVATLIAMASNFWLNNRLTYGNERLRGTALWRGLALFMAVCSIGGAADVGVAHMLYRAHSGWSLAGAAGAAIAVVWNYAVSSTLVWRAR